MSYAPIGTDRRILNGNVSQQKQSSSLPSRTEPHTAKPISPSRRETSPASSNPNYPIIVHCHLCWDWVWQRPQQFISRLSQRHPILFIETVGPDPQLAAPFAKFYCPEQFPNITVLRLQFPEWRWSDGEYVDRTRRELVQEFLRGPAAGRFENAVQWFYDPMAAPAFLGQMNEILTVYDCMDELSQFRGAPPAIRTREATLLEAADVVFTGGRKLYESKSRSNANCHFYGCGVEVNHFGKAREAETQIPDDLAKLPKPVLGYFGVVDERMDYDLVAKLADANPNWSIAIVGPVMKVDPKSLPQRANLHWLGQRSYSDLPGYCKGFELCLMPFALNESTEYINPTKALEYMASARQIVSTAVPDVVSNFGSVGHIASGHEAFIELCRKSIAQPDAAAIQRGLEMAAQNTWNSIVEKLESHIATALQAKRSNQILA